jgi:PAS domain S-box-containing protein
MKAGSRHVAKLEEKMGELTAYARNKASGFLTKAESIRSREKKLSLGLMAAWMVLSLGVAFFTIRRTRLTEKALADETEKLLVTLRSIGDGVITADRSGAVAMMNPVAEQLTGWSEREAVGEDTGTVFNIINEHTREACENPVKKVFTTNGVIGLANHTVLVSKDGTERAIADSGAPIRDINNAVIGVVLVFRDQQAERSYQSAIIESERKYRLLSENTLDVIWTMNLDLEFTYVNPAIVNVTGHTPEEWIGSRLPDHCDEQHFNEMVKIISDEFAKGPRSTGVIFETEMLNKNREPVQFEIHGKVIYDDNHTPVQLQGISRDISNRKRTEEALRASEERFATIFHTSPAAIAMTRVEDNRLVNVNPAWCNMTGFTSAEAIGHTAYELKLWGDPSQRERLTGMLDEQGIARSEVQIRRKTGEPGDILMSAEFLELSGERYLLSMAQDITERKQAQKERDTLQTQLVQAQKMESIGTLAGGIAHDFNNILASIIGFSELALDDVEPETPLNDNLQEIYTAATRARDLVKQILAFARQSDEALKPVKISSIVREVLKLMRSSIPSSIAITQNIASDSLIMGNAVQVHQILMNLLTNAAQAMEKDGGVVALSLNDIVFDSPAMDNENGLKPGKYIELKVSDTGIGIPKENIRSIFDPYFTTKKYGEGTGMGLAVVHGIIRNYGGAITVASQPGEGTLFTIYLPVTGNHQEREEYAPEALPRGAERILFVDDEEAIAKIGGRILHRLGYAVETRTSSVEALELFRSKPDRFDLVITDMTMPDMTGDKLAMEVMKIRPDIPVILCTGYSKKISEDVARQIGIKALVYKPIAKADFAKTTRQVLDDAKSAEPASQ